MQNSTIETSKVDIGNINTTEGWNTNNQGFISNVINLPSDGPIVEGLTAYNLEPPSVIQFRKQGQSILKFAENGDIFIHGRLAENDKEVVEGMRQFLMGTGIIK
jgi:hypothetical protein